MSDSRALYSRRHNGGSGCKQKPTSRNAARERSRVRSLRNAFQALQDALPTVPPNTKLSKLDVLVLAASYISHLTHLLDPSPDIPLNTPALLHPVRKWPMRSRLYAGNGMDEEPTSSPSIFAEPTFVIENDFWLMDALPN